MESGLDMSYQAQPTGDPKLRLEKLLAELVRFLLSLRAADMNISSTRISDLLITVSKSGKKLQNRRRLAIPFG